MFIGITKVHTEPQKVKNITDNSQMVLIPLEYSKDFPEKITIPDLKPLKLDKYNMEDLNIIKQKLEYF